MGSFVIHGTWYHLFKRLIFLSTMLVLRFLSIGCWTFLVWRYFDWSGEFSDMRDSQFWISAIPILFLLFHQVYKFIFQLCYVRKEPTDYTGTGFYLDYNNVKMCFTLRWEFNLITFVLVL